MPPAALMTDGSARFVLHAVYSSLAARMQKRREAVLHLRLFSESLMFRRPFEARRTSPSISVYQSPKTSNTIQIQIGLSGVSQNLYDLQLGRKQFTGAEIYASIASEGWCPPGAFVLMCGGKLLERCHTDCKDDVFNKAMGRLNLVRVLSTRAPCRCYRCLGCLADTNDVGG